MSEAVSYFLIATAVVILLFDLWAMVSVFRSDKTVGVKAAWAIGLIIFPMVGLIVWGIAGTNLLRPRRHRYSFGELHQMRCL